MIKTLLYNGKRRQGSNSCRGKVLLIAPGTTYGRVGNERVTKTAERSIANALEGFRRSISEDKIFLLKIIVE